MTIMPTLFPEGSRGRRPPTAAAGGGRGGGAGSGGKAFGGGGSRLGRWGSALFLLAALVGWLLILGCSGNSAAAGPGAGVPEARIPAGVPPGLQPKPQYAAVQTATPRPTFTPVPTATETPRPADWGLGPTVRPPTATPFPLEPLNPLPEVAAVFKVSPVATFTPTPPLPEIKRATPRPTKAGGTPGPLDPEEEALRLAQYGRLPGLEVYLERQVLFGGSGPDLPAAIVAGDFGELKSAARRIPSRMRFVSWGVRWRSQPADLEFHFEGWVRLRGYHPDGRERFVQDVAVAPLQRIQPHLIVTVGHASAQIWRPGRYVFEFLDLETEEVVVDWEFEVYR